MNTKIPTHDFAEKGLAAYVAEFDRLNGLKPATWTRQLAAKQMAEDFFAIDSASSIVCINGQIFRRG